MKAKRQLFFYVFIIIWSGLIIWNVVTPQKGFSEHENRYLAKFPPFAIDKLINGEFMKEVEEYINDQFVFRDSWILLKTNMERFLLKQDINSVYIAKDEYLIEKHSKEDVSFISAQKNKERLIEFLSKYGELLGKDRVYAMLVPTASNILKDKLPIFASDYDQNAYIDSLLHSIEANNLIDIRDVLEKHKEEYIYYRTDHHWTSLGAYYAYETWARKVGITPLSLKDFNVNVISKSFYGTLHSKLNINIKADEIHLYEYKKDMNYELIYNLTDRKDSLYDYSKLFGKDKYSVFFGGNHALVEVDTNLQNDRRLLVIKDSFAHSMVPFQVNHYEKTYMVDLRYFNGSIEGFIEENEITDVFVLYNTMNFVKDKYTSKLLY